MALLHMRYLDHTYHPFTFMRSHQSHQVKPPTNRDYYGARGPMARRLPLDIPIQPTHAEQGAPTARSDDPLDLAPISSFPVDSDHVPICANWDSVVEGIIITNLNHREPEHGASQVQQRRVLAPSAGESKKTSTQLQPRIMATIRSSSGWRSCLA